MRLGLFIGSVSCLFASTASAESAVDITRSVYLERTSGASRALEPARTLRAGDKVVLVMEWRAPDRSRPFTVSSAVPRDLTFQRAATDGVEMSIDGGRSFAPLDRLHVGERVASVEDVTHLRWRVAPGRARGMLTYSAIVR